MQTIMKLATMAVLLMAVVGICGCTSAPQTNVTQSNVTANTTKNVTKAAVKPTKVVVKPTKTTVKPAATVTPAYVATPVPAVATPTATPYPTLKNLHGDESGQMMNPTPVPTATPKPTQAPTFVWSLKPQAPVMKGGYANFMVRYDSHTANGDGPNYTPHWYLDGKPEYVGTPTSSYASTGIQTNNLSLGVHTVSIDAMGLSGGTLTLSTTFTVIPAA